MWTLTNAALLHTFLFLFSFHENLARGKNFMLSIFQFPLHINKKVHMTPLLSFGIIFCLEESWKPKEKAFQRQEIV